MQGQPRLIACAAAAMLAVAFWAGSSASRGAEQITDNAVSIGAHNLDGMMRSWSAAFGRIHPGASIDIRSVPLSSEGLEALIDGRAQLAPLAREAFPSEMRAFTAKFGYPPLLVCVASGSYATKSNTHAIAVYVNASNPLARLTMAQLDAIYSTTRRRGYPEDITRWGQLGLSGDWADRPIHLYGMLRRREKTGDPPGIVNFMLQEALAGGEFKPAVREIVDTERTDALDGIVAAVANDPAGIGYSGFRNARDGAKTLALGNDAAGPFFAGTLDDVLRRDYPLSRKIFVAVNRKPGTPMDPLVQEFLRFVLSREGQEIVAADSSGYLPLPAQLAEEGRTQLR